MSCHPFKLCTLPLTCFEAQQIDFSNKHNTMNHSFRQLDSYQLCRSNVNDKGMVYLPKGQMVSHQHHIKGQVGHKPF